MKILYQNIKLNKNKEKVIADSKLFSWIDPDFKKWGLDKEEQKQDSIKVAVCEITKDSNFQEIFIKPEEMYLSQEHILNFCENNKERLRKDGFASLFLLKVKNDFFVAEVFFRDDGRIKVRVRRFSGGGVWHAVSRHRVVVPQLALKYVKYNPSENLTLDSAMKTVTEDQVN